ncbi:MAG: hypothetical protein GQ574_17320 [Crocinitomix sp.]|nr:hypothetical protein [Crocinitomix sp.]
MKAVVFISLCLVLFAQCDNSKPDVDLIQEGTMMNSAVQDTCLCDDLAMDTLGVFSKNDSLFTGVCILNYPNTDLEYVVKGILNGQLHGTVIYYDKTGNILVEEVYEEGQKKRTGDGAPMACDCNELEQRGSPGETKKQSFLDDIPFTGKCLKKYPDTDQIYMEVNYKSGLLEGFTIFYDHAGETMYMEKYEQGDLIKVIYD